MAKGKVARTSVIEIEDESVDIEEAMGKAVEDMSDQEAHEIMDLAKDYHPGQSAVKGEKPDTVKVNLPCHLKINKVRYAPGIHEVARDLFPVIREMVYRKRNADLSMFVGKNYLIERLMDRTLVVKEVDNLDLKKMAK